MSNRTAARPRLSVVIPARNALRWLPGAIASLGGARDLEILVVDDGSSDSTWDYLTSIAASDPRVRPLETRGLGPAGARNAALALARAPLIAFLDADDRWRRGKLMRQLELHRLHPEMGFSFTDTRRFSEDGIDLGTGFARCPAFAARHAMRREAFLLDSDAQAAIYAEPLVATSSVMVRTDLLRAVGGFNETLKRAEDWDLWLHLAACAPVGCVPQALTDRLARARPRRAGDAGPPGQRSPRGSRLCAGGQRAGCRCTAPVPPQSARPAGQLRRPGRAAGAGRLAAACGHGARAADGTAHHAGRAAAVVSILLRPGWQRGESKACVDQRDAECERWLVSVIDPEIAGQLAADLPREDFARILRTFESDLGRLAQMLEAAVSTGDQEGYLRAAHSLAGAAAAVGATRLERVARIAMDRRSTADPRALAVSVRQEAQLALAELAALAENPPGSR